MALERLIYVSSRPDAVDAAAVARIVQGAMVRNGRHDITGVLIAGPGWFLQQIEGDTPDIEAVWAIILADARHETPRLVHRGPLSARMFGEWSMRLDLIDELGTPASGVLNAPEAALIEAIDRLSRGAAFDVAPGAPSVGFID